MAVLLIPVLFFALIVFVGLYPIKRQYDHSDYKTVSGNSFLPTVFNKGNYGEFLTFRKLEKLPKNNRLLTNIYIPKKDGKTTEIDLLMINNAGIHVFESKNYSGWIFGDEKDKNWTQSLPGGKKTRFLNPIIQNRVHIKALKEFLKEFDYDYFHSYIVFSERCTLKKVSVTTPDICVVKRNDLLGALQKNTMLLSESQIESIYLTLKKCSLADDATKARHVEQIKKGC